MVQKTVKDLARLARLARTLEHKRSLWLQLQIRLESLSRGGVVVTGERAMLAELEGRLAKALETLGSLEQTGDTAGAAANLVALDQLLSDVEWEVAEQILADLTQRDEEQQKKIEEQQKKYRECEDKIEEWKGHTGNLRREVAQAQKARAPVIQEERELKRLEALVQRAERTLREHQFANLIETLAQLESDKDKPQQLLEQIQGKVKNTRFARQADLLLLRSPLDRHKYEYTVLLRTPTEPGSHGINIQDSSTLVVQDHNQLKGTIEQITKQVNAGLARQFASRSALSVPPSETSSTEAMAATQAGGAETRHLFTDRVREPVISQNINDMAQDIGDLMYRLLMPEHMQRYLNDTACAITITTNDLELPWELMCFDNKFLCLERPVARLPMGPAFPRIETETSRAGEKLRFLLIYADPQGNLPEAGREIQQIKEGLEKDWKDQIEINVLERETAQGRKLNEELRAGKYDVIHYAGHAAFDEDKPDLSALVLHQEEEFYAQKIRRLLEGHPLVFLNACDSGRTASEEEPQQVGRYLQKHAEGLASSFIYGGARGCIGALWPIYDQPAAEFAVEFYRKVLEGHMVGEAMRLARMQIRERYPQQITWAAFVLYGDPTFRLVD